MIDSHQDDKINEANFTDSANENFSERALRRFMDPVIEQMLVELTATQDEIEFAVINADREKARHIRQRLMLVSGNLIMLSLGRASAIIYSCMQKIPEIMPASRDADVNNDSARLILEIIADMSRYLNGLRQEHPPRETLLSVMEDKVMQLNNPVLKRKPANTHAGTPPDHAQQNFSRDYSRISRGMPANSVPPVNIQGREGLDIELRRDFLRTADKNLKSGGMVLSMLVKSPASSVLSREFNKVLGTLKSSALSAGLAEIVELCHSMEMLVNVLSGGDDRNTEEISNLLTQSYAQLTAIVEQYIHHKAMTPVEELVLQINKHLLNPANGVMEGSGQANKHPVPGNLMNTVTSKSPKHHDGAGPNTVRQPVNSIAGDLHGQADSYMVKLGEIQGVIDETYGLLRSNLDAMNLDIGSLRDGKPALSSSTGGILDDGNTVESDDELYGYLEQYQKINIQDMQLLNAIAEHISQRQQIIAALHAGLRQQRMVPISSLVRTFDAFTRKVAAEFSRKVKLNIIGGEISLDRALLKNLIVPLQYLLRYCVERSIEDITTRLASGKPESATITIEFIKKNADIVIKVSDDGTGIDLDRVRQEAVNLGYIGSAGELQDNEALSLVFNPIFNDESDSPQLQTQGVRLADVANVIKSMGGSLAVDTTLPAINCFIIDVPCEWDVIRVLMTQVDQEVYAIPAACVEDVVYLSVEEIDTIKSTANYQYAKSDRSYQFRELKVVLGIAQASRLPEKTQYPVVLIRMGSKRIALQVDQIKGQREIIINQPVPELNRVKVISSATLLGDGRLVLVLELGALLGEDVGSLKAIRELSLNQD